MRKVILLGSTGSIGTQAIDVISRHRSEFEVVGLGVGSNTEQALEQAEMLGVPRDRIATGAGEAAQLVRDTPCDVVLNGITGSVGLAPTLA